MVTHAPPPQCSFSRPVLLVLEYRQQLSAALQNKKNVGFLLLTWQDKATTASHHSQQMHYFVGHVPRSLNSCEAEFEGLLRGNNSSTGVISFGRDGPVERDITHPESGLGGSSSSSRRTQPDNSSPLFVAQREQTTPCPPTPNHPNWHPNRRQGTGNTETQISDVSNYRQAFHASTHARLA